VSTSSEHLAFASATALVAAIKSKEISSRELLALYLDRVDRFNGSLNAVVSIDAEGARRAAHEADQALARGEATGRLHGLPMTVKDCFDVAGMRTTVGDPAHAEYVSSRDAVPVERVRNEGAVFFGRTNVPLRLGDLQTTNDVFGTTYNPWGKNLTPGGSSGGAASALAAGLTAFDISCDFGGSTRVPASHCGLYGLKPTFGTIPCVGMLPMPPGHFSEIDMETPGPIGRSVADLELGLAVMAGPHGDTANGWRLELPKPRASTLADMTVGVWLDDPAYATSADVRAVLDRAVTELFDAGAKIDERPRPSTLTDVMEVFEPLASAVTGALLPEGEFLEHDDEQVAPSFRQWFWINERRAELRARWASYFDEVDAVLAPSCVVAAHPHSPLPFVDRTLDINGVKRPFTDVMAWSAPSNALYFPGASVPAGMTEDGRPVGIQIIGGHYRDLTVLRAARLVDEVLGAFQTPPGY
jgi:amidase